MGSRVKRSQIVEKTEVVEKRLAYWGMPIEKNSQGWYREDELGMWIPEDNTPDMWRLHRFTFEDMNDGKDTIVSIVQ